MVYPPQLLDLLQQLEPVEWAGTAWRHMLGRRPPDTENTRGARWNPPEVAAIYTSLTRDGAVAEGSHALAAQPLRPRVTRIVYEVHLTLNSVLNLTDSDTLRSLGVGANELASDDTKACHDVGGAAAWLEHDGIVVPSARSDATNLVIYPANAPLRPPSMSSERRSCLTDAPRSRNAAGPETIPERCPQLGKSDPAQLDPIPL